MYHLSGDGISKIFGSPAPEKDSSDNGYFDTLFSLHLSEGYTYTVENNSVGFQTSFTRDFTDANPYFDREGNLTEDARENNETDWLNADPYFYLFMPVDVDGDGIFEIMTAQYTYLYGRADGLGSAYTILKWDRGMGRFYIDRAGFWPYEEHEDEESETDYEKRWEDYESSWYLTE